MGIGSSREKKARVAVVCERACYASHSGMNWEGDVVDLSGDQGEQWGGVSGGCVPASVLAGTDSLSQVNVSCDVVVSDLDCEFVEPQTFTLSRKRGA